MPIFHPPVQPVSGTSHARHALRGHLFRERSLRRKNLIALWVICSFSLASLPAQAIKWRLSRTLGAAILSAALSGVGAEEVRSHTWQAPRVSPAALERAKESVVEVTSYKPASPSDRGGGGTAFNADVSLVAGGPTQRLALTAHHVVTDDSRSAVVAAGRTAFGYPEDAVFTLHTDGKQRNLAPGEVLGVSAPLDLAVFSGWTDQRALRFRADIKPKLGDLVRTLGYPGLGDLQLGSGAVIQHGPDQVSFAGEAVSSGFSGGPLLVPTDSGDELEVLGLLQQRLPQTERRASMGFAGSPETIARVAWRIGLGQVVPGPDGPSYPHVTAGLILSRVPSRHAARQLAESLNVELPSDLVQVSRVHPQGAANVLPPGAIPIRAKFHRAGEGDTQWLPAGDRLLRAEGLITRPVGFLGRGEGTDRWTIEFVTALDGANPLASPPEQLRVEQATLTRFTDTETFHAKWARDFAGLHLHERPLTASDFEATRQAWGESMYRSQVLPLPPQGIEVTGMQVGHPALEGSNLRVGDVILALVPRQMVHSQVMPNMTVSSIGAGTPIPVYTPASLVGGIAAESVNGTPQLGVWGFVVLRKTPESTAAVIHHLRSDNSQALPKALTGAWKTLEPAAKSAP